MGTKNGVFRVCAPEDDDPGPAGQMQRRRIRFYVANRTFPVRAEFCAPLTDDPGPQLAIGRAICLIDLDLGAVMARKDVDLDRMTALDEALRRMVRTCPVPRRVRSAVDLLASHVLPERREFSRRENP